MPSLVTRQQGDQIPVEREASHRLSRASGNFSLHFSTRTVNPLPTMKEYMIAVEGIDQHGDIQKGNSRFQANAPLTWDVLQEAKRKHCEALKSAGVVCNIDRMMILAVIPLEIQA